MLPARYAITPQRFQRELLRDSAQRVITRDADIASVYALLMPARCAKARYMLLKIAYAAAFAMRAADAATPARRAADDVWLLRCLRYVERASMLTR